MTEASHSQGVDSSVAVFLDRDGTIMEDTHYPKEAEKVKLIPSAVQGLLLMKEKGYLLFVVSNQSGVGRGIISDEQFTEVHGRLCELLQTHHVEIDEFFYCFHKPEDQCRCRKPNTGLAIKEFKGKKILLSQSFVVGDKECDLGLADNLGAKGILVLTGKGKTTLENLESQNLSQRYEVCENLLEMAENLVPIKNAPQ